MEAALHALVDRIRAAHADGQPLRLRGGGTKDFLGQSLHGSVLDTRAYRGIVAYEPSELVVTVRCGTPLAELQAALAEHGQVLAFDPPHFGDGATVGGMVCAGLSGPPRAAVGAVRDYVLGVRMVNGQGQLLQFGGQVMKNVAGYDVSRLLCGSMGTLGLVAEVSLKVLPRPVARATLVFGLGQAQALAQVQRWSGQPLPLLASAWAQAAGDTRLWLQLAGARAAVDAAVAALGGALQDADAAAAGWVALREQTLPFFAPRAGCALWRLSVPDTAPVLHLPGEAGQPLVEWGGALRWVHAPPAAASALRAAAEAVGGTAQLFRQPADGAADPAVPVQHPLPAPMARVQRALRQRFDPRGILNPGRLGADL